MFAIHWPFVRATLSSLIDELYQGQNLSLQTTSQQLRIVVFSIEPWPNSGYSEKRTLHRSRKHVINNTMLIDRTIHNPHAAELGAKRGWSHSSCRVVSECTLTSECSLATGISKQNLIERATVTDTAKQMQTKNCTCKYTADKSVLHIGSGSHMIYVTQWYGCRAKDDTIQLAVHFFCYRKRNRERDRSSSLLVPNSP